MDIILSNSSDKPIYEQIASQIRAHILAGTLVSGEKLPSIRALANGLGVSVITTKRAYSDLEEAGFIEHEQIGIVRKRHGKLQFHAHAAGEILHFRLARKRKPFGEVPELCFIPRGKGGCEAAFHLGNGEFRRIGARVEHHSDA